ncbi:molybdopterin cofactor-binding domain-containing protein [Hankyongella ginsenosidimutans]|uniref:molybdopterin cofactor-binding domain-containing protein n=1 Tax=Hankyongella ginsenosidimutans TaxID=1763828 RepID=UPI001CA37AF2|nr:molybdopterin cofactor-binding domain-containing protein [Hankyongella ginsenosidimutans]
MALHCGYGSIAAAVLEVELQGQRPPRLLRATLAVDCGDIIHPDIVRAQMTGGFLYGLSDALYGHVSYRDGHVTSLNFDRYPLLALAEAPPVTVVLLANSSSPGGIGELATPLAAPRSPTPSPAPAAAAAAPCRLRGEVLSLRCMKGDI